MLKFTTNEKLIDIERADGNILSHVYELNKYTFIISSDYLFSVINKARYVSWWALISMEWWGLLVMKACLLSLCFLLIDYNTIKFI